MKCLRCNGPIGERSEVCSPCFEAVAGLYRRLCEVQSGAVWDEAEAASVTSQLSEYRRRVKEHREEKSRVMRERQATEMRGNSAPLRTEAPATRIRGPGERIKILRKGERHKRESPS